MGITSMILGIVSIVIGFMPIIWSYSILPAIIAIVLGIISLVKKQEKGKSIVGIILSAIVIVLVVLTYMNIEKEIGNISSTTSTNIETGKQQTTNNSKLKEQIKIETLGIATNGDFIFKVSNKNNQTVYLDTVNVIFKDENGNFMEKANSDSQYFGIGANEELILLASGFKKDYSKYPNYEYEFELSSEFMSSRRVVDNFELLANNTGEQVSVQVKNNNDLEVGNIHILVAYYKSGKIVGCVDGYDFDTKIKAQGTAYINVEYPEDSKYKRLEFDDYKVYLVNTDKTY